MPYVVELPRVPAPTRAGGTPLPPALLSCVYFFWQGEECVYVGQTKNLRARLARHRKYLPSDVVTWLPMPREDLLRAEGFFIWLLHPRRNFQSNWEVAYERKRCDRPGYSLAEKRREHYRAKFEISLKNAVETMVSFHSDNALITR